MHFDGNQMNLNVVNPYSAAAEKAAATQRAAHMRRMRRKRAKEAAGVAGARMGLAPCGWMHSGAPEPDGMEYNAAEARDESVVA